LKKKVEESDIPMTKKKEHSEAPIKIRNPIRIISKKDDKGSVLTYQLIDVSGPVTRLGEFNTLKEARAEGRKYKGFYPGVA